jgi:hypothetical protein
LILFLFLYFYLTYQLTLFVITSTKSTSREPPLPPPPFFPAGPPPPSPNHTTSRLFITSPKSASHSSPCPPHGKTTTNQSFHLHRHQLTISHHPSSSIQPTRAPSPHHGHNKTNNPNLQLYPITKTIAARVHPNQPNTISLTLHLTASPIQPKQIHHGFLPSLPHQTAPITKSPAVHSFLYPSRSPQTRPQPVLLNQHNKTKTKSPTRSHRNHHQTCKSQ